MRGRPIRCIAACLAVSLSLAACGGDDDDEATATTVTLAPTTTIVVPIDPTRCEDIPDPDDYPEGEAPTALRPCEVPDETVRQVIREGSGPTSAVGDGVIYHATAVRSEDGELVESSWGDGRPHNLQSVGTGAEIPGLDQNLVGVQAGEVLRLDIPADEAFGDTPPTVLDTLGPDDAVTFVIDVLAIVPTLSPDDAPLNVSVEPSVDATEVTTDDVVVGDGKVIEEGDVVVVAMLIARGDNEVVLFNSWHQRNPLVIPLDPALMVGTETATLPGVFEGLQGATVGSRRVITMPASDAWGEGGNPALGLPPDTDVIVIADILAAY
jgi:FKBP-type peptidyl-prolyl cis-trans isomerase